MLFREVFADRTKEPRPYLGYSYCTRIFRNNQAELLFWGSFFVLGFGCRAQDRFRLLAAGYWGAHLAVDRSPCTVYRVTVFHKGLISLKRLEKA